MNKFNETELLEEVQDYIDDTYKSHYADNKYQATDIIIDAGLGEGFCMGNIEPFNILNECILPSIVTN